MITLFDGSTDTFSLLPPDTNNAEVEVLTQNVVLSTNLVGRWYRPDNSYVTQNSLTFTIFHQTNEGLYKFYVTDWNGELTLAIQIDISIMGMLHTEISDIIHKKLQFHFKQYLAQHIIGLTYEYAVTIDLSVCIIVHIQIF